MLRLLEDILRILKESKEDLNSQVVDGFQIIRKTFGKMRENWQSYVLTPISIVLGKSDYQVYTHVLGVKIPRIEAETSKRIKEIIPWCETTCNPKYKARCLERSTTSEIDSIIVKNSKVCFMEHARNLGGLCWDMVKLFKISASQDATSCLFFTWYDLHDAMHREYADNLTNLGKMLFNDTIGENNWATVYLPYLIENQILNLYDLEIVFKGELL